MARNESRGEGENTSAFGGNGKHRGSRVWFAMGRTAGASGARQWEWRFVRINERHSEFFSNFYRTLDWLKSFQIRIVTQKIALTTYVTGISEWG
jgi:hypothetical protein